MAQTLTTHLREVRQQIFQKAEQFVESLPQSLDFRKEGKHLFFTFVRDEKPPVNQLLFRRQVLDHLAGNAWSEIFSGFEESDLVLLDLSLVFSILFWNNKELLEIEFLYDINDLLQFAHAEKQMVMN